MRKTLLFIPFLLLSLLVTSCKSPKEQIIDILNSATEKVDKAKSMSECNTIAGEAENDLKQIDNYEKYLTDPDVKKASTKLAASIINKSLSLGGQVINDILPEAVDAAKEAAESFSQKDSSESDE